ncbi:MAG: hypothetical protein NTX66_00015, partial [Candidatus Falkowbacteria bacterium]|nr:hypothetical protein [Candidatus Falkowbacteria bacterium]
WKQALSPFTEKKISLQSLGTIETPLFGPKNYFKYALNYLLGGNIFGLVRKVGAGSKSSLNREELLICPVCLETGQEINLHRQDSAWLCAHCERSFPIHEGVLFLLTDDKFRTLYPEIYENKFF